MTGRWSSYDVENRAILRTAKRTHPITFQLFDVLDEYERALFSSDTGDANQIRELRSQRERVGEIRAAALMAAEGLHAAVPDLTDLEAREIMERVGVVRQ